MLTKSPENGVVSGSPVAGWRWWSIGAITGLGALWLALSCGSLSCSDFFSLSPEIREMRGERVLAAFCVGGLLSLAGGLLQLLLRNPLADPYVLGVSSGAAAGALVFTILLPGALGIYSLQLGALTGAVTAIGLLFLFAGRVLWGGPITIEPASSGIRLILTGVMISSAFSALVSLMFSLSPDVQLRGTLFWLMGDLEGSDFIGLSVLALFASTTWALSNAALLNILSMGEVGAHLLGLPVRRLQVGTLVVASIATASAVTVAGAIGFIGLVVPHSLRLLIGNDQRRLLPASVFVGGVVLAIADLLARTLIAPTQLPVGVITALVGAPVFLFLLARSRS